MSFENFDPERLLPESIRPEIYGLAIQNNPNLVESAQDKLKRYIDDFKPVQVYEEIQKPTRTSIIFPATLGSYLISTSLQTEDTPAKIIFGGLGLAYVGIFAKLSVMRYKSRNLEPELSKEAKRYMYLKFFEKK
jgi:hypothetical protein